MKKYLICAIFLVSGLCANAQYLYVQTESMNSDAFLIENQPKITFNNNSMTVELSGTSTNYLLSDVQKLFFAGELYIDDNFRAEQIFAYPNPVKDELILELLIPIQDMSYQLLDINGKQLASRNINSATTQIQMQSFPVGTYFLQVNNNVMNMKSFKIIKQ